MAFEITYEVDYRGLKDLVNAITRLFVEGQIGEGSSLVEAVQGGGDHFAQTWLDVAQSKFRYSQGNYAKGVIGGIKYPYEGNPLEYRITHSSTIATDLEYGTNSFDMKKMLDTSDKVRISKDGKRYLIIPFRHGTPGAKSNPMPKDVYKEAKQLNVSYNSGKFEEGSIKNFKTIADADLLRANNPVTVMRRTYDWGERLNYVNGSKLDSKSIYKNMVKFQNNPNIIREKFSLGKFTINVENETENFGDYSAYMTFRAMVEGSPGWIHPGIKPMNILGETKQKCEGLIMQGLAKGAEEDIRRAIEYREQGLI